MICVIQLDGLGTEPLDRLLDQGELPFLCDHLNRHPRRPLDTPADRFPAAVYPSLYTGTSPAEHGLFYPFQWDPDEQRIVTADRLEHPPTIWQQIGQRGGRSLVIDPYECGPAPAPNARVISGWQLSERVVLRRWSRPRSLWPSLIGHGAPPRATETFGPRRQPELNALFASLLRSGGRVADLAERELRRGEFDLAWISFIAPHIGGHRLWASGELDAIYRSTDDALGRVLAALPSGIEPIVICPLGMAPDRARADLLPEMLARVLGGEDPADAPAGHGTVGVGATGAGPTVADPNSAASTGVDTDQADQTDSGAMWRLRAAVPSGLRSAIARTIPAPLARALTARLELRGVDWSRTKAFAHPSDNQGYVRFNLAGRERDGIVDPAGADALAERIAAGLSSFVGADGEPAVAGVDRIKAGTEHGLPDLVVRWAGSEDGDLASVSSPRFGEVQRHGAGSGRNGNHPADGAWISGEGLDLPDPARIESIAPAILSALD